MKDCGIRPLWRKNQPKASASPRSIARAGLCFAARGGGLDRGRSRRGEGEEDRITRAGTWRTGDKIMRRRQAAAGRGAHAAVSLSQAARTGDHDRRPAGRPTIFGALPKHLPRLISIGRLDLNTEGLLLLTNDGGLARALELPARPGCGAIACARTARSRRRQLDALREGVDGRWDQLRAGRGDAGPRAGVQRVDHVRDPRGQNREVRNVLRHLGLHVARLIRVSFGPFQLGDLAEGEVEEVPTRVLRDQLGEKLARRQARIFRADRAAEAGGRTGSASERRSPRAGRACSSPRERSGDGGDGLGGERGPARKRNKPSRKKRGSIVPAAAKIPPSFIR